MSVPSFSKQALHENPKTYCQTLKEPMEIGNEMYLLPPGGEQWIYHNHLKKRWTSKPLFIVLLKKGIHITGIKGVTFKQFTSRSNLPCGGWGGGGAGDSTFFVEYFWALHRHKSTGPHSG